MYMSIVIKVKIQNVYHEKLVICKTLFSRTATCFKALMSSNNTNNQCITHNSLTVALRVDVSKLVMVYCPYSIDV